MDDIFRRDPGDPQKPGDRISIEKISVELNMTYSQFCNEWNANEFLDSLLHPADNEPDEDMSYQGMNLC